MASSDQTHLVDIVHVSTVLDTHGTSEHTNKQYIAAISKVKRICSKPTVLTSGLPEGVRRDDALHFVRPTDLRRDQSGQCRRRGSIRVHRGLKSLKGLALMYQPCNIRPER
jgi:hypothetical protein